MTYYAGSAAPYPKHRTVAQLIEHAASRWPQAPAVCFADEVLTYAR